MRKIILKLTFTLCAVVFLSTSCQDKNNAPTLQDEFVKQTQVGVYKEAKEVFVYEKTTHQFATSSSKSTYRVQSDDQQQYFHVDLGASSFARGEILTVELDVRGISGISSGTYSMEIVQHNSQLWLWNKDNNIGIIVPATL